MDETSTNSKRHLASAGLIIAGIIVLLPGACGSIFLGEYLYYWISNAFDLQLSHYSFSRDVIRISLASLFGSIILLGLMMRHSRWQKAPAVSLGLSILAGILVLIGFATMSQFIILSTFEADHGSALTKLALTFAGILLVVGIPPLLHWRKMKMRRP